MPMNYRTDSETVVQTGTINGRDYTATASLLEDLTWDAWVAVDTADGKGADLLCVDVPLERGDWVEEDIMTQAKAAISIMLAGVLKCWMSGQKSWPPELDEEDGALYRRAYYD